MTPGSRVEVWLGPSQRGTLLILGVLPDGTLVVHLVGGALNSVHLVEPSAVVDGASAADHAVTAPEAWVEAWLTSQAGPIDLKHQTERVLRRALQE